MSKTLEIIESMFNIIESEEEFNEAAYEEFQKLKGEMEEKIGYMVSENRRYTDLAESAKKAEEEAKERKKYYENQAKKCERFIDYVMSVIGKDKMETGDYRISYRKSTQTKVVDGVSHRLPSHLRSIKMEFDQLDDDASRYLEEVMKGFGTNCITKYSEKKSDIKDFIKTNDKFEQYESVEEAIEKEASLGEKWVVYEGVLYETETRDTLGSIVQINNIKLK